MKSFLNKSSQFQILNIITNIKNNIAVFLVLYRDTDHLERLIESLLAQSYNGFDVIAVDSDPAQETIRQLKNRLPKTICLDYHGNLGYAGGNNLLFSYGCDKDYDLGVVLNTDVVLDKNFMLQINAMVNHPTATLFSPLIYRGLPSGKNQLQNHVIHADFANAYAIFENWTDTSIQQPAKTEIVAGCAFAFKFKELKEIGLFPADNFMYGEEIDLAYRLKNKGLSALIINSAIVFHNHDWDKGNVKKINAQYYYSMRNRFLFFWRYNMKRNIARVFLTEIFYLPYKIYWAKKTSGFSLAYYYYVGIFHGLLNVKGKRI